MKHEHSRQSVDAARELVGHWINMFCDAYMIQHFGRRFCHGENLEKSLAWHHLRFATLPNLLFAVFDQCMYGLVSPRPPHKPHKKTTPA